MPDILNPLNFFWKLGYREVSADVYAKRYPGRCTIRVDFANSLVDYGDQIRMGDGAIAKFSQRNYVIAECVDRLLMKGYLPNSLYVGYTDACDIAIRDEAGGWLAGIRCRRWDDDAYDKEVRTISALGSRPVTLGGKNERFRFVCVYASTLKSGLVDYGYTIFPLVTSNRVKPDKGPKGGVVSSITGLFEDGVEPYRIVLERKGQSRKALGEKPALGPAEFEIENGQLTRYRGNGKSVTIPNGVKGLRNGVFWDHPEIEELTMPNSVTSLGGETFSDCTSLVNLTVPQCVSEIGDNPFCNCPSLALKNKSPDFNLEDGALYDREKSRLIYYSMSNSAASFEIPNGVISIGKHAIHGCSALKRIIIPPSLAVVENNPFSSCPSLKLVNHSPHFVLENDALYDKGMRSIFYFAISGSPSRFVIPEGVATIQRHSFYGCNRLSSVTLPRSLKVIGYNPFANCPSLTLINRSPDFVVEGGVLYDKNKSTLIYYPMSSPREDFIIPDTVKTIGRNAFFGCDNLKSVTIPYRVECISKGAFSKCTGLAKIAIPGSVSRVEDWAFYGCTQLSELDLPKEVVMGEHAFSHCNAKVGLQEAS